MNADIDVLQLIVRCHVVSHHSAKADDVWQVSKVFDDQEILSVP